MSRPNSKHPARVVYLARLVESVIVAAQVASSVDVALVEYAVQIVRFARQYVQDSCPNTKTLIVRDCSKLEYMASLTDSSIARAVQCVAMAIDTGMTTNNESLMLRHGSDAMAAIAPDRTRLT